VLVADIHVPRNDERRKRQRVEVLSGQLILKLVRVPVTSQVASVQQKLRSQLSHLPLDGLPAFVDGWPKAI